MAAAKRVTAKDAASAAARDRYPRLSFPWEVGQSIGWYVYALRDPRPRRYGVFYVGKGTGDRVFAHVQAVLRGAQAPDKDDPLEVRRAKADRIRAVHTARRAVEHLIVRDSLASSSDALAVEQAVIDGYLATGHALTNIVRGHLSGAHGLTSAELLMTRRGATPAPAFPAGSLIVQLRESYYPGISAKALYDATRGNWGPSKDSRDRTRYVFGIVGDVIVSGYAVKRWRPATTPGETHPWAFVGNTDPAATAFVGTHVRDVLTSARKEFRTTFL